MSAHFDKKTNSTLKLLTILALLHTLAACQAKDAADQTASLDTVNEQWPGGSLNEWESEGSIQSFTQSESGGAVLEDGATYESGAEPTTAAPEASLDGELMGDEAPSGVPHQEGALEGGEIDDNDDLEAFLDYYESERLLFDQDPSLEWRDLSERHLIIVTDQSGVTVPDARLTFTNEEGRILQIARTRADGSFAFFPLSLEGADDGAIEVQVRSRYGQSRPVQLDRAEELHTLTLNGVRRAEEEINLEVAFIIDATGSMGGEINRLKETISSIAERVGQDGVRLRLGAVAYRDRGEAFTTRAFNFTEDVEAFQEVINSLDASGGGDYPEALNQALHETQRRLSWTPESSLRLTFLITDAPAHYYEDQQFTYADGILDAQQMGMKVFPIASGGSDGVAELQLRQIALQTLAHFIFITEGGGSPAGSEGSEYHVDPAQFDVEQLDDLVVRLINEELDAWRGPVSSTPL